MAPGASAPGPAASSLEIAPPPRVPKAWENPPPPRMAKQTYSGLVAFTDVVVLTGFVIGVGAESRPLMIGASLGYLLGGPIMHSAHCRYRTAAGSLGLRVLTPLLGAGLGAGLMSGGSDSGFIPAKAVGAFLGAGVGVLLAPVLDASLLARQEWFDDLRLAPEVALSPRGGTMGLTGVF